MSAVAALKAILATLTRENEAEGGAINDTIWHRDGETLFDFITFEIEAAEKVEPVVDDLLVLAVECGLIRMSQVMNVELQDNIVKFVKALPTAAVAHEPNAKLMALADRIDHEQLWRRPGLECIDWPQEKQDRMMAGVSLRRYANLLGNDGWRIYPPKSGISFRADTLDKVVQMAQRDEERRCPLCNYQHGHAIGCENNPVDQALAKPKVP